MSFKFSRSKKIEKALDYLCSGVLYDSEILENETASDI